MPGQSGEKTEKATPKKRREQRKEGNVATSKDVTVVVSLFLCFYCLPMFFPTIFKTLMDSMVLYISAVGSVYVLSSGVLQEIGMKSVEVLVKCIIPLGLIAIAVAVIVTGVQTKFLITMKPVGFKLKNLNPLNGIKKLFSVTNLVELLKAAL